jgi:hypothetical protein
MIKVYCADVGSVKAGKFAWGSAQLNGKPSNVSTSSDIRALVDSICDDVRSGNKVALGFECPLYVPLSACPEELTKRRSFEGNRPWSAGAGPGSLVTGLVEMTWIFIQLAGKLVPAPSVFLDWKLFKESPSGILLWEAFVSGKQHQSTHKADASLAVRSFIRDVGSQLISVVKSNGQALSLVGCALLRSGLVHDSQVLSRPCPVIVA